MSLSEDQADCCPHCRKRFEIVHVRFRLNGTAMVACCPNCAMVSVDVFPAAGLQIIDKARKLGTATRAFWQKAAAPTAESTKKVRSRASSRSAGHSRLAASFHLHLRRASPRRNSRGCPGGHPNCCARNSLLPQKAPAPKKASSQSPPAPRRFRLADTLKTYPL
jgi:hypothetical protein